jgi:DNA-3-methyladenine glycosylase
LILERAFYERNTFTVARELLGKILVHKTANGGTSGKIVETEAYMGPEDKASHAYKNLRTRRTEVQYGPKGHAYIYFIYGMYYCLNVTSGEISGKPEAILIRAVEPIEGIEIMLNNRKSRARAKDKVKKLTSGPGKLCDAMEITTKLNGHDFVRPPLCIKDGDKIGQDRITEAKRIGVDYAGKWKNMPWRYCIKDNDFVSRPS